MPKTKPRRSRKDYFRDTHSTSSTSSQPQQVPLQNYIHPNYVHPQSYIPSQTYPVPNLVAPISNVSLNNVTMTMHEYNALMRHSRTQQLRCIYFPDCCQRIQPMNAWCSFCISQYMFPGLNNGVYPGMLPCTLPVCNVPSICAPPCTSHCPTSTCSIPVGHQTCSRPKDTCPFPDNK